MKPAIAAGLVLLAVLVYFIAGRSTTGPPIEGQSEVQQAQVQTPAQPPKPVLADTMLAAYGTDESTEKEDLHLLARFLDSVFLLVKSRDTADYATNEDLVLFLLGSNSHQSPFITESSSALNKDGQLIDRWGSPIIVHPVSQKLLELRTSGPDKTPYTADDLQWPRP